MSGWAIYFLIDFAVAIVAALVLRRYVCMLAFVKGRSMQDTLENHELVLARIARSGRAIARFDIVLCRYPGRKELFVKRVVGLPGERVALREGTLFIDDLPVEERFALRVTRREHKEMQLGAEEYFVLGDNRPVSSDSRRVGPIRREMIIAVATHVIFPFRRARRLI